MEKYKLSELIVIKNGRDHKDLPNGDYPVFGSGGVMRYVNSYLYDKPSVLLPRKGSLSNIQYSDTPFWTVDTLYYTEINEELVSPYYLYRYLRLLDMSRLDSGTGVPSMTFDSYYNINVFLPNIEEQRRVASILQKLDAKIALNRQINDNLEAMAKQLYDYWFVQFDFPNEEGKPYKSSGGAMVWNDKMKREIPQGWGTQNLADCLKLKTERVNSKDIKDTDNYTPIEVIPRKQMSLHETVALENAMSGICRYSRRNILLSNRRVYFHKVCIAPFDGLTRDTVLVLEPYNSGNLGYLYETVFADEFILFATKHSYGSEQPVLSWTSAQKFNVLRPSNTIDKKYSEIVDSIIDSVLNNQIEIIKLTKQRDELLPLLMNGQASVNSD